MNILESKLCQCCGKRKVQGTCIINGVRRNLPNTCRYCFLHNPEDVEIGKRNRAKNYYRLHKDQGQ
jgi:hypothetical protein